MLTEQSYAGKPGSRASRETPTWLCLGEPAYPIPPFPGREYDDPTWHTFFAFSENWKTSAGRVLENFCDWTHIPFVHDGVLGSHDLPRVTPSEAVEQEDEDGFSVRYSYEQVDQSHLYGAGGSLSIRREFVVYLPFMGTPLQDRADTRCEPAVVGTLPVRPQGDHAVPVDFAQSRLRAA